MTERLEDARRWEEDLKKEAELAQQEAELNQREAQLGDREKSLREEVVRSEQRLAALSTRLAALVKSGVPGAAGILATLPQVAPGPGVKERSRALAFRREALLARQASAAVREKSLGFIADALGRAESLFNQAEVRLVQLQSPRPRTATLTPFRQPTPASGPAPVLMPINPPPAQWPHAPARPTGNNGQARVETLTPVHGPSKPLSLSDHKLPVIKGVAASVPSTAPRQPPQAPAVNRTTTPAPVAMAAAPANRGMDRQRMDCRVDLWNAQAYYQGSARDISTGGLFVATLDCLPLNSEVAVGFTLQDGTRIETRAVIRWIRELEHARHEGVSPGMGLEFQQLTPHQFEAIERFQHEQRTLAPPNVDGLAAEQHL